MDEKAKRVSQELLQRYKIYPYFPFDIQASALPSENKATPEWELELRPDLLARSKESILSILNTGSVKDLLALHRIGKKKAQLIVGWKELYGPFEKVSGLRAELFIIWEMWLLMRRAC